MILLHYIKWLFSSRGYLGTDAPTDSMIVGWANLGREVIQKKCTRCYIRFWVRSRSDGRFSPICNSFNCYVAERNK